MERVDTWPGKYILLVFGKHAFNSVFTQGASCRHLKNIVIIPFTQKIVPIDDLYGGEPIFVVDAQYRTYSEMSLLHTNIVGKKRIVYITPDFPYWHHSFKVEEKPFGIFNVERDNEALETFCCGCFGLIDPAERDRLLKMCHNMCFACCASETTSETLCLHSSHKREYILPEDALFFDGLQDMDVAYCSREECDAIVDPRVSCKNCHMEGFCSELCLRLKHEC